MVVRVLNSNINCRSHLDCKLTLRSGTLCHACRQAVHERIAKARSKRAAIPAEFADDWRMLKRKVGSVEARRILNDEIARKARKPIPAPALSASSLLSNRESNGASGERVGAGNLYPKPIAQER